MTATNPKERPKIEDVVRDLDELLKTVSPEMHAQAVKAPLERGAVQPLPACTAKLVDRA